MSLTNILTTDSVGAYDWHILILFADSSETEIRGVWGPYPTSTQAGHALEELEGWPLDGTWSIVRLKKFVAPVPKTTTLAEHPKWRTGG